MLHVNAKCHALKMADVNVSIVSDIKLLPEDIPGATIDDVNVVAKWTVEKLKSS